MGTFSSGRPAKKRTIGKPTELTEEDIAGLDQARAAQPAFKTFRDSYHAVARLVAIGLSNLEVAAATGYGVQRIVQLRSDPTFQSVAEHYRTSENESFRKSRDEHYEVLCETARVAARAQLDKLHKVLDSEDGLDNISFRDLDRIVSSSNDRTGYGKKITKVIEHDLADRLASALAATGKVIEGRAMKVIENAKPELGPLDSNRPLDSSRPLDSPTQPKDEAA